MIQIITPEQSRMARAALDMGTDMVRQVAGLGTNTITRFEKGNGLQVATMQKLVQAYRQLGVEFPDENTVRYTRRSDGQQAA